MKKQLNDNKGYITYAEVNDIETMPGYKYLTITSRYIKSKNPTEERKIMEMFLSNESAAMLKSLL